jgi:hypothetical protein
VSSGLATARSSMTSDYSFVPNAISDDLPLLS